MKTSEYLLSLPGVTLAIDCSVTIDGETLQACEYRQIVPIHPGCPAYDRGEREHEKHALYVVGKRPAKVKARGKFDGDSYPPKFYFRRDADERDWYCACYHDGPIEPEFAQYHPFGPSFMLMPWTVPSGEAPDYYQDTKAQRVRMIVA